MTLESSRQDGTHMALNMNLLNAMMQCKEPFLYIFFPIQWKTLLKCLWHLLNVNY